MTLRNPVARLFRCGAVWAVVLWLGFPGSVWARDIVLKSGQSVAFLGDSITQLGASEPGGFVKLVTEGLAANGVSVEARPAGVGGNMSNQMLKRLDHDVLQKKPDWVVVSCGVNDVNNGKKGVPLELFRKNLEAIVNKTQAAGAKVLILTATRIGENADDTNERLDKYNDFLKALAERKKCLLGDPNAAMKTAVETTPHGGNLLTVDGIHLNPAGHEVMAAVILAAFGLNQKQLAKAHKVWLDIPGAGEIWAKVPLTLRQYEQLAEMASRQKKTANALVDEQVGNAVNALLKENFPGE